MKKTKELLEWIKKVSPDSLFYLRQDAEIVFVENKPPFNEIAVFEAIDNGEGGVSWYEYPKD